MSKFGGNFGGSGSFGGSGNVGGGNFNGSNFGHKYEGGNQGY